MSCKWLMVQGMIWSWIVVAVGSQSTMGRILNFRYDYFYFRFLKLEQAGIPVLHNLGSCVFPFSQLRQRSG
jgi:hypothetical protein